MIIYGGKMYPKRILKSCHFLHFYFVFIPFLTCILLNIFICIVFFCYCPFDFLHNSCVQSFDFSWFYWWIWPIPTLPYQWEIISSPPKAHVPVSTNLSSCHRMCKCPSVFHMQQQAHVDIHVSFVLAYKHITSTLWDGNMINKCSLKRI